MIWRNFQENIFEDVSLKIDKHILNLCSKASAQLNMPQKLLDFLDFNIGIAIYNTSITAKVSIMHQEYPERSTIICQLWLYFWYLVASFTDLNLGMDKKSHP